MYKSGQLFDIKQQENAERIDKELRHERAGVWYISDSYGSKILVKLPSSTIKAIIKGCRFELLFAIDEDCTPKVLHTGLRIFDDQQNPQLVMNTQRFLRDHFALLKIMYLERVQVQFCNELSAVQTFGDLKLDEWDRHRVLAFLGNPKQMYVGDFNGRLNRSLDKFQAILNPREDESIEVNMRDLSIIGAYEHLENINHSFYGGEEPVHTNIGDALEGEQFEKEIFVVLQSLFTDRTYHAPKIKSKSSLRELIDIFAISDYGVFLIEAKALGVYEATDDRTMARKILGLQKQIKKAIGQLVGASKTIKEGQGIFDSNNSEIVFDRGLFPHGIVLISEMMHFGDWSSTVQLIIETMSECKMFIHVMDLQEFLQFIGYSNQDKDIFDSLLMQRAEKFVSNPKLHVRWEFVGE